MRPTYKTALTRKASSNTNLELLWRQAREDGVYNIAGILTRAPGGSTARFIGAQIQQEFDYTFSRHLSGSLANAESDPPPPHRKSRLILQTLGLHETVITDPRQAR